VLDPSFAPGTGMPEAGRLSSRELLRVLRGLTSLNLVSADLVEVARPTTMPRSPRSPPRR
jgi:agmatinase